MIVGSTDALRDTRSLLVAWGMVMTRLVLLVVDYLCHVIVHFRCMYEVGVAPAMRRCLGKRCAMRPDVRGAVRSAAKPMMAERKRASGGNEPDVPDHRKNEEFGASADIVPASLVLIGKPRRPNKYQLLRPKEDKGSASSSVSKVG